MSKLENIAKAIGKKLSSEGHKVEITPLSRDWNLARQYIEEYVVGSFLLGLSELPTGYGNWMLFSKTDDPSDRNMSLEVGGHWIWINSSISSITIKDEKPFDKQDHSALIAQVYSHVHQKIVAVRLWEPLPHIALEFSDGSLLAIHGDCGMYESWGFYGSKPRSFGIYALPGGPISVG